MATSAVYKTSSNMHDENLETYYLLWLDAEVNTSEENRIAQQQLRSTINHVTTFEDGNLCQQYIQSISIYDRIILIVSGRLGQEVVPRIHDLRQLSSIYVYCIDKQKNEEWAKNFTKVKGVTVDIGHLIDRIKRDQTNRIKEEDPIVINIFTANQNPDLSTTCLNGTFVHSLLLVDVLLRMTPAKTDKTELIRLCKKVYKGNKTQLNVLRDFDNTYTPENALWWYTRESFLYKILNKALRVQNIDILFIFRFFMRDIYRALEQSQCQSTIRAYRGQILSNDELKSLRESIGELISINSFFSTTTDRKQALVFLNSHNLSNDLQRVLFIIDADPSTGETKPFANISSFSDFENESEVLFMIGSIFHLKSIRRQNDKYWIIQLTMCSNDQHDLANLFQYMKEQYGGGDNETSLLNFGQVLRRMGKFDLAEKFYRRSLNELAPDAPSLVSLYYSLGLVLKEKKELDSSLEYLHKSLKLIVHSSPKDYQKISMRYNAIGTIHRMKNEYDIALVWLNKGIKLLEKGDNIDHSKMAHFCNNIATIYEKKGDDVEALNFNKKALTIRKQHLPSNHPDIGMSHNNIGSNHHRLGHYDLALKHYNQSLNIRLKSMPSDHPHIGNCYRNIGLGLEDKGRLNQALEYFQKSAAIYRQALSSHDPDLINIEADIIRISSKLK
ncbi:unnamed protein product [Rotaria magnacalcarata]|uniref:NAD(P)(+)--arginine ADP-ribosyltransferase n=1 Tax=Rotaria magnacalcarata TaxID=392030 RepID=A0A816U4N8_9BILA|nr:unnamed protein product [Rotaria magnacalcarata]CAF2158386.1 unnamed protein product [Rotaria magnacalcarata]CAF3932547.1 unnamed protein product [Rotaria magnacalcarata]CAF4401987.1 unnamed protein product [Rotaria magnacalcarata]